MPTGRAQRANTIAEAPVVLWFLLVLVLVPLLNLGTAFVRAYFLYDAAHIAAQTAAKARSFEVSGDSPSAIAVADSTARDVAGRFHGVTVSNVRTSLVVTNSDTRTQQVFTSRLTSPPNSSQFTYQVRVTVTGSTEPLFLFNLGYFLDIPGLTAPMAFAVTDQAFVENTQGLMR